MTRQSQRARRPVAVAMLALVSLLAACGSSAEPTDSPASGTGSATGSSETPATAAPEVPEAELRVMWWGNDERAAATTAALDVVSTVYPQLTFTTEYSGSDGYFQKFATQVAGGNPPDIVQMNVNPNLRTFGSDGALLDLTPYVESGALDLSGYDESALRAGYVDGNLYGIPLALAGPAVVFNTRVLDDLGIDAPAADWDWTDFVDIAEQVHEASGGSIFGASDSSTLEYVYGFWAAGRTGESLYDDSGARTDNAELAAEWWQLWQDMRESGATIPADIAAEHVDGDNTTNPVALGRAVMQVHMSAAQTSLQGLVEDPIGMQVYPSNGDYSSEFVSPSFLFSIASTTDHPDAAVAALSALLNDEDAIVALGGSRGVPASTLARDVLVDNGVDEALVVAFAYIDQLLATPNLGTPPLPSPTGASDVEQLFTRLAQDVSFGRATPQDAAASLFEQIPGLLGQAVP